LARRATEKIADGPFELITEPDFALRYRPARLIDAIWQRFAEEITSMIACAKCTAPKCGRWFPRSVGRGHRQYCCHACQMRAWRATAALHPGYPA
jgi:hypothetical protein